MDVRCEKCQTEYELDESRLKPGGVTVKCTNCGHMFKIRKRSNTNVGLPASANVPAVVTIDPRSKGAARAASASEKPAPSVRSEAVTPEAPVKIADLPSGPTTAERQWLVRLENGDTKTCRELAALQQWIVAGVIGRESLISRTGKTWKRLGDITELGQYFVIADEARAQRAAKPTGKGAGTPAATMIGVGGSRRAPDEEEDERRATGNFRAPPAAAPQAQTPAQSMPKANPVAQTEVAPPAPIATAPQRPPTQPPPMPPPRVKPPSEAGGRQTAAWVNNEVKTSDSMVAMPQGPRGGKLSAGPEEPGFAGRVRIEPSSSPFDTGRVHPADDDDDVYPASRGSRAGMWIALASLLVIGAAAGAIYMFVFKDKAEPVALPATSDAAEVAVAPGDAAALTVTPVIDAAEAPSVLESASRELGAGVWARMKGALANLEGKDDPASLAMRARLWTAIAQGMQDRAGFVDKAESDKLRKEAKQIVIDAAPLAQRALGGQADSASANLAMADVMRLQAKPAPAVKRYIETARSKAAGDKELMASVSLAEAQLAMRDGKLPDAEKAVTGIDAPPDDMRIKLVLAQIWYAQTKTAEAKAHVDHVIAMQPDNDVALAMYKKLETSVANSDPLPPEDGPGPATKVPANGTSTTKPPSGGGGGGGGDDYDSVLSRANKLAETNCSKAMDLYAKALEQRPNGVEALTGMGYCHLDAKQFSSAFSKFRAALAVSSKFEPALGGVAETYQRQGNKEAAIEAWRKYLETYPNSAKAKKQLEILGASDAPKEQPKEQPTEAPPPAPAPAPGSEG